MAEWVSGRRLSVFIGEQDRYGHRSLAEAILERAREEGLAGATMTRGIEGFGPSGRLRTTRFLSSSDDLPIVIEIIDDARRIARFAVIVDQMVEEGLVVVEDADVRLYHDNDTRPLDDA